MAKAEPMAGLGVKPGRSRLIRETTAGEKGRFFTLPDFWFIRLEQTKLSFREKFPVIWRKAEIMRDEVRAHKMENLFRSFFKIESVSVRGT